MNDATREAVRKLGPFESGQLLVFRGGDLNDEEIRDVAMWLATSCDEPPLLLKLPADATLEVLTEKDMNEAGWVRSPAHPVPRRSPPDDGWPIS